MSSVDPSISSDQEHDSPLSSPFEKFSPTRCTTCNAQPNPKSQNLVVCIDGTSNRFGQNNSNVVKLFAKINLETQDPQPKQYTYYTNGIGTRPKTLNVFDRVARAVSDKFDMAFAWNIEEIVKDAYGWLARMYQEGDQIYLFGGAWRMITRAVGFSRGAYQVRVLAGMIHEVGLIRSPTEKQVGAAYDHYRSIRWQNPQTRGMVKEFKKTFSRIGLRVHFVGVWDMVSSVGLVQGDDFISTSSSAARACHIRHALALDERRVNFMPDYFHEMNARPDMNAGDGEGKNKIKEVWFAGSHSDVYVSFPPHATRALISPGPKGW
ncbi:hypothetical protein BS17DRAFT_695778 [Gyrodon lividus]|nr:hypothetical protein BS17DRAFT_695778 [Gyrodon lividus]